MKPTDRDRENRIQDQLAFRLRSARLEAGLTGRELAERCGISQSKVSKIERSNSLPTQRDVAAIADVLGISEEEKSELASMALELSIQWIYRDKGSESDQLEIYGEAADAYEEPATQIDMFTPLVIPSLLQTAEYAVAGWTIAPEPPSAPTIDRQLVRRVRRQALLHDASKQFRFLIGESALYQAYGSPSVVRDQLRLLVERKNQPNVSTRILKNFTPLPRPPVSCFVVYDKTTALLDQPFGDFMFQDEKFAPALVDIFERLWDVGVEGEEARGLINDALDRIPDVPSAAH